MSDRVLVCRDCGERDEFWAHAATRMTVQVNNEGQWVEDIEVTDMDISDDIHCMNCDSHRVEYVDKDTISVMGESLEEDNRRA